VNTHRELTAIKEHQIATQLHRLLHSPVEEHEDEKFRRLQDDRLRMEAIFKEVKANPANELRHPDLDHFLRYYESRQFGEIGSSEAGLRGRLLQ